MTNAGINQKAMRIQKMLRKLNEEVEAEIEKLNDKIEALEEDDGNQEKIDKLQARVNELEEFDNDYLNYDLEDNLLDE